MNGIALALSQPVLESGVLPDLEDPRDILTIDEAPIAQAPTGDGESWGFERRGRRFRASLSLSNLCWAVAIYAPEYGINPDRAQQFIAFLKGVSQALGEAATPDELYTATRDLLAMRDEPEERIVADAYRDLWEYEAQGGYIFDQGA